MRLQQWFWKSLIQPPCCKGCSKKVAISLTFMNFSWQMFKTFKANLICTLSDKRTAGDHAERTHTFFPPKLLVTASYKRTCVKYLFLLFSCDSSTRNAVLRKSLNYFFILLTHNPTKFCPSFFGLSHQYMMAKRWKNETKGLRINYRFGLL